MRNCMDVVVEVGIKPQGSCMKVWTQWKADSGVKKTLLSEEDWRYMKNTTQQYS